MSDLKDIECWECKEKFKEFLSFRVHLWFKHTTTYGSTIYPKDLEKCGKVLVDKEHLERLEKWLNSSRLDCIKKRDDSKCIAVEQYYEGQRFGFNCALQEFKNLIDKEVPE